MRTHFLSVLVVAGCTSASDSAPPDLIGTWTGVTSNGTTERYVFSADGTFDIATLNSAAGFSSELQGTFSIASQMLTVNMKGTDGVGNPIQLQVTSEPYIGATALCDEPLLGNNDGIVGSWTSQSTTLELDLAGMSIGDPSVRVVDLELNVDGTFSTHDDTGTYVVNHDTVTTTDSSAAPTVKSYTFVDGAALCDPVLRK